MAASEKFIAITRAELDKKSPGFSDSAEGKGLVPLLAGVMEAAVEFGYLVGFQASGEGWNGEYPFEGRDPEADPHWTTTRDLAIAKALS